MLPFLFNGIKKYDYYRDFRLWVFSIKLTSKVARNIDITIIIKAV